MRTSGADDSVQRWSALVLAVTALVARRARATAARRRPAPPSWRPASRRAPSSPGLTLPTSFQFAPDGKVFVAEKAGVVKVFDNLNDTTPTVFADLKTEVYNYTDRGLLSLAVDPQWPARPYVYVLYAYDHVLGDPSPGTEVQRHVRRDGQRRRQRQLRGERASVASHRERRRR